MAELQPHRGSLLFVLFFLLLQGLKLGRGFRALLLATFPILDDLLEILIDRIDEIIKHQFLDAVFDRLDVGQALDQLIDIEAVLELSKLFLVVRFDVLKRQK